MSKDKTFEKYSPILRKLLFDRGIKTEENAECFLNPDYQKGTHSPFLLKDMDKASDRILRAFKNKEKICIYSDYDADGIPGAVILHDYFKKAGYDNFFNYIPHREKEGFGLNKEAVQEINKKGASLIITVDCGVSDVEEIETASKLGLDVIVTDHHLPNGKISKAFAVINPKQKNDEYPFEELCGAGLSYKLVQALLKKKSFGIKEGWEKWLLDMVGIATVSDMVPLRGENRVLAHFGLKVLRKSPRPGIREILRRAKVSRENITEDDVGFLLAPRINSASRMDKPHIAFEALSSKNPAKAVAAVKNLESINRKRKGLAAFMVKDIKRRLSERENLKDIIVIGHPEWKPGLLGLAAARIAEEFDKPAYVWGRGKSPTIKGSFRSNQQINVFELTNDLPDDFFLNFGGHTHAGGFDIANEKIHSLEEKLNSIFSGGDYKIRTQQSNYDHTISLNDVTFENYRDIRKLGPFGIGNPKPTFLFEDIKIDGVEKFGKGGLHTKLLFNGGRGIIESVSFFQTPESFNIIPEKGKNINLVASMEENNFRGRKNLRLRTVDIL